MEGLKKFLLGIFRGCFVLVLISLLCYFSFDGFVEKGIADIITGNEMTLEVFEQFGVDKYHVEKIVQNEHIQEFLKEIVEGLIYDVSHGEVVKNKNLVLKIKTFIIDNREELEDVIGYKMQDEFIDNLENLPELQEIDVKYQEMIDASVEYVPSEVKNIMVALNNVSKISYSTVMIILLVVLLGIIIALHWSLYRWTKDVGGDVVGCGVFMFIVTCITSYLISNSLMYLPVQITFDFMKMFYIAVGTIIVGIVIRLVYTIVEKIKERRDDVLEVS